MPLCKSPPAAKADLAECRGAESLFPENVPKSAQVQGISGRFSRFPLVENAAFRPRCAPHSALFVGGRSETQQFLGERRVHLEPKSLVRDLQVEPALLEPPRPRTCQSL